jgi:hypothetical protein
MLRIAQENYSGHTTLVVAELPDTALHKTDFTSLATSIPTSRQEMIAFPEKTEFPRVGQDSRIFLMYRPDSVGTEDFAQFSIPITVVQ